MHASKMADTQGLQRCKHKKERVNGAIPEYAVHVAYVRSLRVVPGTSCMHDIEPIRVNMTRNARPSLEFLSLEVEIPDYISRNGPYIGGHLAFYFKLNFKHL